MTTRIIYTMGVILFISVSVFLNIFLWRRRLPYRPKNNFLRFLWWPYYTYFRAARKLDRYIKRGKLPWLKNGKGWIERVLLRGLACFPFITLFNTIFRLFLGLLLTPALYCVGQGKRLGKYSHNRSHTDTGVTVLFIAFLVMLIFGKGGDLRNAIFEVFAHWRILGFITYAPAMVIFQHYRIYTGPQSIFRSLVHLAISYVEMIICFAILYLCSGSIAASECQSILDSPLQSLYFSAVTITTLGYGDFRPISSYGCFLVIYEVLAGLFFVLLIFGDFLQRASIQFAKSRNTT